MLKLVGISANYIIGETVIMKSKDLKVLQNMKELLEHFEEYKEIKIVKA